MRRSLFVLLAAGTCAAAGSSLPDPKDEWVRLDTANFHLVSNAGVARTKDVGIEMERLRAVLARVVKGAKVSSPIPTNVFVFRSDASMEPYKPRVAGKPANVSGFFVSARDQNLIAVSARANSEWRPIVYHEYLHHFLHTNLPPVPTWYDEGIAEYYGTFQATDREVRVGKVPQHHLHDLLRETLLPLQKLLAVTSHSPEYDEKRTQGLFYAESWALVHYLSRGAPERAGQLGTYLQRVSAGMPREEAFREAFHTDETKLLAELDRYLHGSTFQYLRIPLADLDVPAAASSAPLRREDVLARLGDLLFHVDRDRLSDAEAHFDAALAASPAHAGALAGLGRIRAFQKRPDEALALLRRAAASDPSDFEVHYLQGVLALDSIQGEGRSHRGELSAADLEVLAEARHALQRSIDLNGEFAEARAALGESFLVDSKGSADTGIAVLEEAYRRLPGRADLARALAALYERKGDRAKSEGFLRRALGSDAEPLIERRRDADALEDAFRETNRLLKEGRSDEAIAALEKIAASTSGDVRENVEAQLKSVRGAAARTKEVAAYNAAIVQTNGGDPEGALVVFRRIAASPVDPAMGAHARELVERIEKALNKRKPAKK